MRRPCRTGESSPERSIVCWSNEERVSVLDFKTGRVPAQEADIPASHRAQMAAYVEALRVIFPGKTVRAALLYTAGPRLFELPS